MLKTSNGLVTVLPSQLHFLCNHCSVPAPFASCWRYNSLASPIWTPSPPSFLQNLSSTHSHSPSHWRPRAAGRQNVPPTSSRWLLLPSQSWSWWSHFPYQCGLGHEHVMWLGGWDMRMSLLRSLVRAFICKWMQRNEFYFLQILFCVCDAWDCSHMHDMRPDS